MKLTKKMFTEEVLKTKQTIQKLKAIKKEQAEKYSELVENCDIGLEMNRFVLSKLEAKSESFK